MIITRHIQEKASVEREMMEAGEENDRLKRENLTLSESNTSLSKQIVTLGSLRDSLEQEVSKFRDNSEQQEKLYQKTQQKLLELQVDSNAIIEALIAEKESIRSTLDLELKRLSKRLEQCELHNQKLSGIAHELLNKYENKGFMNVLIEKEPFTKIKRIEIDKMMNEYEKQIEGHRIEKPNTSSFNNQPINK